MRTLARLSLNQKLGTLALALGGLALFADVSPGHTVKVDARELLTSVARAEDHVTAPELAAWIVEGRADYRLVDLRDERAYAEYHVPGAVNVPLATVLDGALSRTEKLVLYGDGVVHAAQAWMVLKGRGFTQVHTLQGGLDAWKDEVLFPVAPQDASADAQARFAQAVELAKSFGGQPRAAAAPGAAPSALPIAAAMPAVAPPALPAGAGASGPRKKREGC
jgi:rhodanese-related sulfurtransferase